MNKVTTINLNGNAYQLEEKAYEQLHTYLAQAAKKLAGDPDKDEILADFERTIAEKCDGYLNTRKNVITAKEVEKIIKDMGPVEPAEVVENAEDMSGSPERSKRLYTLRDGAVIGGVANGLAAYFNVDVTIVRLLFVLLVFVSGGMWILIYLLLMLIVPEAQTPEQKAELRGERFSAQDVLDRAKQKYADLGTKEHWQKVAEQNRPALSGIGEVLEKLVRVAMIIVAIGLAIALSSLTVAWASVLWALAFRHVHLTGQLSTISPWTVALGATAGYFIAAVPLGVLIRFFGRVGRNRPFSGQGVRWWIAVACLWIAAVGVGLGVAVVTGGRISDYRTTHGYLDVNGHSFCINNTFCHGGAWQGQPTPLAPQPYYYHYQVN